MINGTNAPVNSKRAFLSVSSLLFALILAASIAAMAGWAYRAQCAALPDLGGAKWRVAQENSVCEAVFRAQIASHRSNQICFLSIRTNGKETPSPAFMQRFQKERAWVKPLTKGAMQQGNRQGLTGFLDTATGKPALHFWIGKVRWLSDARADVEGGGAAAGLSGNAGIFSVIFQNHRWQVKKYRQEVQF